MRTRALVRLPLAVILAGVLLAALALPLATPFMAVATFTRHPDSAAIAEVDQPSIGNTRMLAATAR